MAVIGSSLTLWEALAGRAPDRLAGPADPGVWTAVVERLNPARARPGLRSGIETAHLCGVRGEPYVMLRSPDRRDGCYLRLTAEEWSLAELMDGTRTVARLVAEFARITGRLAPEQVTRVVADLAANRMLEELPVDAFGSLARLKRRPWPVRLGGRLLAVAQGRRLVAVPIDPLVGLLYRAGGRLLFTRPAGILLGLVALAGLVAFVRTWAAGGEPSFLTGGSYATGALVLLGLNVLALACHELGHALAAKHAGRRVPTAGLLVYFGLPSVFVDTTDVWMAGRRARLRTTAAGPAAGLVLAGAAQLASLAYPPLAPWTFKLSFAWYVNVVFNLNPFVALDGYYLLMDWLEVPNLRPRATAWLAARLRRRPPRFADLDREGRLVALYGMLCVAWLGIAANLAYRVYADRVGGLVLGLWYAGWPQRLLLAAVVAGLTSPLCYLLARWLGRRGRRLRERIAQRSVAADTPRRFAALQTSALGGLPGPALTRLAADARWVRPRAGERLIVAGAAQRSVYVVVEGGLEGRRPGDPGGCIRQRVGAGGVVGLAAALTGAPSALTWHAIGASLLAVPASTVAAAVGPLPGPHPADRAEVEHVLEHAPAMARLSAEDRLALAGSARPASLAPGASLTLPHADAAAVVTAGMLIRTDGVELRPGHLIGPVGLPPGGPVARARTVARLWFVPAVGGLSLLLGAQPAAAGRAGTAPLSGAHPPVEYPPLAVPPGEPPSTVDDTQDRRFERKLWWLLILLLLFGLLLSGTNLFPGPVWAEMPDDRALLHVERGVAAATINGAPVQLHAGDDRYVAAADRLVVGERSLARLTLRGGAYTVLCGGSSVHIGQLSAAGRPADPSAELDLSAGRLLADTAGTSTEFTAARFLVTVAGQRVGNAGPAQFAVAAHDVTVTAGTVTLDDTRVPVTAGAPRCGGPDTPGVIPEPHGQPASPNGDLPSPSPAPTGTSASAAASATPQASGSAAGRPSGTTTPRATPTPSATSPAPASPPPTTAPPRDTVKPVVSDVHSADVGVNDIVCGEFFATTDITATISDGTDPDGQLTVSGTWSFTGASGTLSMNLTSAHTWTGRLGPFNARPAQNIPITVSITASDTAGNTASGSTTVTYFSDCPIL